MPRYSQVKNLSVFTITEGKRVGIVDDLRLDPRRHTIAWLRVRTGGPFGGEAHWVQPDAITGIGQDLVTIRSESDLQAPDKARDTGNEHGRPIVGSRVVTEDGRFLGEIRDFVFEPGTYVITELAIRQGNVFSGQQATIPGDRLVTVGSDAVVVARDAMPGVESKPTATHAQTQVAAVNEAPMQSQDHPMPNTGSMPPANQPAMDQPDQPPTEPRPDEQPRGVPDAGFNPGPDRETGWTNVPPDEANHLGARETEEPDLDKDAPEGGPTIR